MVLMVLRYYQNNLEPFNLKREELAGISNGKRNCCDRFAVLKTVNLF